MARFPRVEEETVDPFTPAEFRAIVETAESIRGNLATWIRLWAQSGMRSGEVTALQVQDVDMERGVAVVRRTYSRERLGPTKTQRVREVSFLHPVLDRPQPRRNRRRRCSAQLLVNPALPSPYAGRNFQK